MNGRSDGCGKSEQSRSFHLPVAGHQDTHVEAWTMNITDSTTRDVIRNLPARLISMVVMSIFRAMCVGSSIAVVRILVCLSLFLDGIYSRCEI